MQLPLEPQKVLYCFFFFTLLEVTHYVKTLTVMLQFGTLVCLFTFDLFHFYPNIKVVRDIKQTDPMKPLVIIICQSPPE